jgi:multidrug efflux pump subunit AcrA (membrane-fusion protein)
MVDIARPESVIRKKKMKRAAYGVAGLTAILLITVGVSRLRPAAPSVEWGTLWPDTVRRGPMVREVRGTGTLVPEDTRWIPATTAGRVERILLRSGAIVEPESVIMELSNPELEQQAVEARLQFESAQAQLLNRQAELESNLLTQRSSVATVESEYSQAELQAQADARAHRLWSGLVPLLRHRPAGSARDVFLHTGAVAEVVAGLSAVLGPRAEVHAVDDLVAAGAFGVAGPRLRARLGDVCVLPAAGRMAWLRAAAGHEQVFRGHHGGLHPDEVDTWAGVLDLG